MFMKGRLIRFVAVAGVAIALAILAACDARQSETSEAQPGGLAWTEDANAALQEAARTGKPVLLDFFATWCVPCQVMDRETYPEAIVKAEAEHWIAVRVDVDRNAALAERYRIQAVPTLVFVRPDGTESSRLEGFVPAGELASAMKKLRESLPRKSDSA